MRFNRGSIMAPIGSPTKMTGRDQMSIGGLGGGMDFDTSQFLTKSDMPTRFDPSQLEQQIGGLQKQIGNIPSYDDTNIRNMIGNIPQFDDSAIRRMIEDNQRSIGNIPSFDPSNLQSGIAGLTNRLDNLNIPDYKAPDLSGFARKEDIPSFDRSALRDELFKDITGSIKVPEAPIFDRDALIRDIRGGINIPQAPDLSAFDTRFADMQKRIDELSQRQAPEPFGGVNLGGTPITDQKSILDDFVPPPGYKEGPTEGGPAERPGGPISIRPDLLPPKRGDFMSIGGPGGIGATPDTGMLDPNTRIGNYGLDRQIGGQPLQATPAPVQPAPTEPAAVAPTAGADPTQTQMPMGAIDPVLLQQQTSEKLTDPLIRSLYFGTQDSPGFYQQLQQAGSNLIGSDVPLQQTAGLSPLELLARQQAVAGLGGFEPFLQQNRDLVNQAIAQSRRAEELQDPYYTQAEEIYKDTMGAYDPSMTQQFYNPYEDAVVQKTIQDVMEAGDKQDIASRAREISSGAFGGSRARLGAEERRESLGEGLAQALGNIRSQGFQSAQATGLGEFARQQAAKRTGAQGLMGIGVGRGSAASQLGSQLAGYGSQIGGIGQTQEQMRAGQRGELSGYGGIGRGIAETGLGRIFEQQVGQQYRPMQTLGQIGSMLPGYQASQTQIDSGYGMPTDPSAAGLGAAFSAYGALAPRQGQT